MDDGEESLDRDRHRGPDGAGEGDLHEGEQPGEDQGMVLSLRRRTKYQVISIPVYRTVYGCGRIHKGNYAGFIGQKWEEDAIFCLIKDGIFIPLCIV
jgi:hypothetical protein